MYNYLYDIKSASSARPTFPSKISIKKLYYDWNFFDKYLFRRLIRGAFKF